MIPAPLFLPSAKVKVWTPSRLAEVLDCQGGLSTAEFSISPSPSAAGYEFRSQLRAELSLTRSSQRDRQLLGQGSKVVFVLGNETRLELEIAGLRPNQVVDRRRISPASEAANSLEALMLYSPSKSVRFSPTVRLQSASGEESVEAERYEEERDAPAAQSSFAVVSSLGTRHELSPEQPQLFVGTDIPFGSAGPVACLALAGDCLHLVLPRATKARGVEVWLRLPPAFPLKSGDTADLWGDDGRLCTVQFDIPKPARSVPKSKKDGFNPAQAMPAIALETSWQDQRRSRWNGAVECAPTSAPRVASFAAGCEDIRLGRACQVGEPDQTLSSHHATVSSHPGGFFSLRPSNAKPVYLLAGKRDQQSRPAIPLRLGDTFVAGKSEFCVVFQQRGNRVALAPDRTVRDELHLRVAPQSTSSPTKLLANPVANLTAQDEVVKAPMLVLACNVGLTSKQFFLCSALETTIGSLPSLNHVSLPSDGRMSAMHCRVYFCESQERWFLEDLGSTHGTFLRVKRDLPLSLCPGDVLSMGLTTIRVLGGL
ncbi:hypothetical protein BASA81_001594 [Batrachochytrium salamandrivorans]|nr:hypothetical protein BASA81_001594 [Batrachochytrium salamandrivorans]